MRADTILIVKHERKLYLLRDNSPLRSYRIALGLSPTGAKEHEWDFRTPEGSCVSLEKIPPKSTCPSPSDRKRPARFAHD
jgi:hypothetical protein